MTNNPCYATKPPHPRFLFTLPLPPYFLCVSLCSSVYLRVPLPYLVAQTKKIPALYCRTILLIKQFTHRDTQMDTADDFSQEGGDGEAG
jgi:hypothetical protein